jgi:uridine kinase
MLRHGNAEALRPGQLAKIINNAIDRFQDRSIQRRINETANEMRNELREIEQSVYREHADAIAEAQSRWDVMHREITSHLDAIAEHQAIIEDLTASWREHAEPTWQAIGR